MDAATASNTALRISTLLAGLLGGFLASALANAWYYFFAGEAAVGADVPGLLPGLYTFLLISALVGAPGGGHRRRLRRLSRARHGSARRRADAGRAYRATYSCGPMPMLAALARLSPERGVPGEAALESEMGSGFGACLGCAVPHVSGSFALCCQDGPVFRLDEVRW